MIRSCVKCTRYRTENLNQLMGNLPKYRVNACYPFEHCGVDYAGPIQVKCTKGRGFKTHKGYVAVFVCMATKAIHLEAVSELSSDAFLAALRRFFARRGKSRHMYSDNGTNFVGAAKKLDKDFFAAVKDNAKLVGILAEDRIEWHFIPPGSPHFGGLWEAGVKSMKYHLKRVIGENKLTFEELTTVLAQIEGVLNSRPLYAIGDEADDEVLTPGHFLIGRPLIDIPEPAEESKISSLNRWRLLNSLSRHFWRKWKDEYLTTLQNRYKWAKTKPNVKDGQLVLVKDEDTHPSRWPMGKIIESHPGNDGLVRVVSVKTQNGIVKRPIRKICPLEVIQESDPVAGVGKLTNSKNDSMSVGVNMSKVTILMLALLFGQAAAVHNTTKTSIETLAEGTAVYMDNKGIIDITTSTWNMMVYYNLTSFLESLTQMSELTNRSRPICDRLGEFQQQCQITLQNFGSRIQEVERNNHLFMLNDNRRPRRGVNFVGSVYHWLFGLMDNGDREEIESNMEKLLSNQYKIENLLQNQSSFVDATMNVLQKTTDEVNKYYKQMQERVDNITIIANEHFFVYKEVIKFMSISSQMESGIQDVEKTQQQIMRMLMDINHGKVSPDLLKPNQINQEIQRINEWLPEKLKLPGSRGNQVPTVLQLLTGKAAVLKQKLVIQIKIPLISTRFSNVFKVIPVPVQKGSTQMIAAIGQPYVVFSHEGDVYHLMSEMAFHQCKVIADRHFMCEGHWAWQDADDNSCEISPLKPHKKVSCQFIEASNKHMWINLDDRHRWIFKASMNASIHVVCGQNQQDLFTLPSQGILTLASGCSAQIGKTQLPATNQKNGTSVASFGTHLLSKISGTDDATLKLLGPHTINNTAEVANINNLILQTHKGDWYLQDLQFHHVSGHSALILVIIVIVVLFIGFIRLKIRERRVQVILNGRRENV